MEAKWGRIVSISSHAGQSGALSMAHYSAAKGGVISLTKALARELAGGGTTVNTIAPSVCETPQMLRAIEAGEFSLDQVTPLIPIPRAGKGIGAPRIRDLELLQLVADLLTGLDGKPRRALGDH